MNQIIKVMRISIFVNIFLSIIKVTFGWLLRSGALVADGIHSLSDLTTDFFAIIGSFLSRKPADHKHPYGHGNIEYITSLVIALMIMIVGFSVIESSIKKDFVTPSILVALVSFITILCKLVLSNYIIGKGTHYNNQILLASGKESRADVMSSIVVLLSSLLIQFSNYFPPLAYTDKVATIIVGIFIIRVGFVILKENISFIIGEQETDPIYLKKIEQIILETKEIIHIDSLVLLKYGSYYKLNGVVSMNGCLSLFVAHSIIDKLESKLKEFDENIGYITIHMEPEEEI